ncbi:ATP-binding protein [Streptomyces sp. NPDC003456]|uniref:ATP-binding protein n=1 Tax=Streptomyces sp. NPDC003456 TaxID=3364683 RepID=UPI0036B26818
MARTGAPGPRPTPPPAPDGTTPYGAPPSVPGTPPRYAGALAASAALRVECSREGFARARSFTRDTLHTWSLDHCCDDTTLIVTELAANAATHAAPAPSREGAAAEIRLGFVLEPTHLLVTVSDCDDRPPSCTPAGVALEESGRGLCIVDALSDAWGWAPTPPAGKTVWAKLPTRSTPAPPPPSCPPTTRPPI